MRSILLVVALVMAGAGCSLWEKDDVSTDSEGQAEKVLAAADQLRVEARKLADINSAQEKRIAELEGFVKDMNSETAAMLPTEEKSKEVAQSKGESETKASQ